MNTHDHFGRISLLAGAFWRLRDTAAPWIGLGLTSDGITRAKDLTYCIAVWIALPLAVFTCNGLLGLLVHWVALAGAASMVGKAGSKGASVLRGMERQEGEATCSAARMETR